MQQSRDKAEADSESTKTGSSNVYQKHRRKQRTATIDAAHVGRDSPSTRLSSTTDTRFAVVMLLLLLVICFSSIASGAKTVYFLTFDPSMSSLHLVSFNGQNGELSWNKEVGHFHPSSRAVYDATRQHFWVFNVTEGDFAPLQLTLFSVFLNGTSSYHLILDERGRLFDAVAVNSFLTYSQLFGLSKSILVSIAPTKGIDERWKVEPHLHWPPDPRTPTLMAVEIKHDALYYVNGDSPTNRSSICYFDLRTRRPAQCVAYSGLYVQTLDIIPETNGVIVTLSDDGRLWKLKPTEDEGLPVLEFPKNSSIVGGSYYDSDNSLLMNLWNSSVQFGEEKVYTLTITSKVATASVFDQPYVESEVTLSSGSIFKGDAAHKLLAFGVVDEHKSNQLTISGIPIVVWMAFGGLCTFFFIFVSVCLYCCTKKSVILSI